MFDAHAMRIILKPLLSILIVVVISSNKIIGQIAGPNSPGTGSNKGTTISWSNPGNITTSDTNYSTVSLTTLQFSDTLTATNFGFSIPTTATIDGVVVEIQKYGTRNGGFFGGIFDAIIQLTTDGSTPVGDNKLQFLVRWSTTESYVSYGGSADGWNAGLTPALINSNNFGLFILVTSSGSNTAYVNHVRITIHYTVPTPINLISFDGEVIEEVIELKWQTSWEKNNNFYTIEKSSNGLNYMELATVDGKGTTEFISDYTYIDPLPYQGNNYYRLSQTDFDGTYEVFKPIMVQYIKEGSLMKIYPNPVSGQFVNIIVNPDLLKGENNQTYILVRSITGELVYQQIIPFNTLGDKISLNKRFESGIYILELHSPFGKSSQKLIVN